MPPTATRRRRTNRAVVTADTVKEALGVAEDGDAADDAHEVPKKRKAVIPFQMEPVKPVGIRPLNAMFYGPWGHGKTTLAGSADQVPSMNDVLFINAESGDMSLTSHRTLDLVNLNSYEQFARVYDFLSLHIHLRKDGKYDEILELEKQFKATVIPIEDQTLPVEEGRTWFVEQRLRTGRPMDEPFLYNTVIVDSLSEVYRYLIYQFTGVDIGNQKIDVEIERMEEWQSAQEMFRFAVRTFRDLPMNVIFVASQVVQDPDRKKGERHAKVLPKFAGQMAGEIAGFIDIVGYLIREPKKEGGFERKLYLGAGYEDFISKHRFENLPDLDYVLNPTLSTLHELSKKDAEAYGSTDTKGIEARTVQPSSGVRRTGTAAASSRRDSRPARQGGSRRR